jgi:hypothetical protein
MYYPTQTQIHVEIEAKDVAKRKREKRQEATTNGVRTNGETPESA